MKLAKQKNSIEKGVIEDPFEQYLVAYRYDLMDLAIQLEPTVASRFPEFCDARLRDLVNQERSAGHIIVKLAKSWCNKETKNEMNHSSSQSFQVDKEKTTEPDAIHSPSIMEFSTSTVNTFFPELRIG
jgi:hypothetical protein